MNLKYKKLITLLCLVGYSSGSFIDVDFQEGEEIVLELSDRYKYDNVKHPKVGNSKIANSCDSAVQRIKQPLPNWFEIMNGREKFTDLSFNGKSSLYYDPVTDTQSWPNAQFKRWSDMSYYWNMQIFGADGLPKFEDVKQQALGNCYFLNSISTAAEFPELIMSSIMNKKNDNGIYAIKFFVRGKPWIVVIDDIMVTAKYNNNVDYLIFASPQGNDDAFWAPLLEKAWAKVKGTYTASEAGFTATGLRAITGSPVFEHEFDGKNIDDISKYYGYMKQADDAGYLIGFATEGGGDDSVLNQCGVPESHALSVISVFEFTDDSGIKHDMMLIRNPWKKSDYNMAWSANDKRWNDNLVKQIPFNSDPRLQANTGIFVAPKEVLVNGRCFSSVQIAHFRDDEGFKTKWYDFEDQPSSVTKDSVAQKYTFTPKNNKEDIYVSHIGYYNKMIPKDCMTGSVTINPINSFINGRENIETINVEHTKIFVSVHSPTGKMLKYSPFVFAYEHDFLLKANDYVVGQHYLQVYYETWANIPQTTREYTVRTYTKDGLEIRDKVTGKTNMNRRDEVSFKDESGIDYNNFGLFDDLTTEEEAKQFDGICKDPISELIKKVDDEVKFNNLVSQIESDCPERMGDRQISRVFRMHKLNGYKQSVECKFASQFVSIVRDLQKWRETVTKLKYCIDTEKGTSYSAYEGQIKKDFDEKKATFS